MKRLAAIAPLLLALSGCLFTADQIDPTTEAMEPDTPSHLFSLLEDAYETRDVGALGDLLADDYVFVADAASLDNSSASSWGRSQELERHRKMFQAISNVQMKVEWDATPQAEEAERESTWTVWDMRMEMEYDGSPYLVQGSALFRLRATEQADGTLRYAIVRWADLN